MYIHIVFLQADFNHKQLGKESVDFLPSQKDVSNHGPFFGALDMSPI